MCILFMSFPAEVCMMTNSEKEGSFSSVNYEYNAEP